MDKKRIFISSVQKEFEKERLAIKRMVESDPIVKAYYETFVFEIDAPAADKSTQEVYGKHESVAPNPHIARAMFWVKYIEMVGTGLNELLDACAMAGLKRPTIEANDIHFRLIIWRSVKNPINEPLNEPLKVKVGNATTQSVFEVIVSNSGIKQKDLCDLMGISTASAKRHIALLDELIEHRGSKKTGGYYAKEQKIGK